MFMQGLSQSDDEIPSYISITPRVGTQDYSDYWAATAPTLYDPTAIQAAILNAGGPSQMAPMSVPISTPQPVGVSGPSFSMANAADLVKAGLTAYGQIQLMDLQSKLIAQGKPPLTAAQVRAMAPQLNFGLAPDTQNMVMYALLGGGALLILMSVMKSNRKSR